MNRYQHNLRISRLKMKKTELDEKFLLERIRDSRDNPLLDVLPDDVLCLIVKVLSPSDRLRLFCIDFRMYHKINHDSNLLNQITHYNSYKIYRDYINSLNGAEGIWNPESILTSRWYDPGPGLRGAEGFPGENGLKDSKTKKFKLNTNDLKSQSRRDKRMCRNI